MRGWSVGWSVGGFKSRCVLLAGVSVAADDDVEGDGVLAAVEDIGEQDGGSIDGVEGTEGEGAASVVDQGVGAEADDEGEAVLLEPADELGLAEAGVGEEEGGDVTGEEAGDEGAEASFDLVLAVAEAVGMVDAEGQG